MTTQLCFDPARSRRGSPLDGRKGSTLPVHVGVPGVAEPHELLAISARIGVADTHRSCRRTPVRRAPDPVRRVYGRTCPAEGLAPVVAEPNAGIVDLHVYTFNAVDVTERWRVAYLDRLGVEVAA
jgi:methylenetetrahydrofolate reductase (NADPH)